MDSALWMFFGLGVLVVLSHIALAVRLDQIEERLVGMRHEVATLAATLSRLELELTGRNHPPPDVP